MRIDPRPRPTKVAFVMPAFAPGGAEGVVISLVNNLDRRCFEPLVIVGRDSGLLKERLAQDVRVLSLCTERVREAVGKLRSVLISERPDIVFGTLGFELVIRAAAVHLGIRTVARLGNMISTEAKYGPWASSAIKKAMYALALPGLDLLVCQSFHMQLMVVKGPLAGMSNCTVIPNPADTTRLDRLSKKKPAMDGPVDFVALGNLRAQKGHERLIWAFSRLLKNYPERHLTIIGDGPLRGPLERQIRGLRLERSIRITGHLKNPFPMVKRATALVSASHYEGVCNASLEAQLLGVPVVATDCPSGNRSIIEDKVSGRIVANSEEGIHRGLMEAIFRAPSWKSEAHVELLRRRHDLDIVTEEYESRFRDLLGLEQPMFEELRRAA